MTNLGLGIDTGGTYTDSVLLDLDTKAVLRKAKALTTKGDLSVGIDDSVTALDDIGTGEIRLVSMSTTLATNSVVEGKGCRVALILIGMEQREVMPVEAEIAVRGGHTISGQQDCPLELNRIREFIDEVKGRVDAFAISALMSIRNPEHELAAKSAVEEACSLPVICGHELSGELGFYERAITAVLNAKLIPTVSDLMRSVRKVLSVKGIEAPLMVVKGDGSLMAEKTALTRPIETALSGPAASLMGAKFLTGDDDAVIIDVGGTTTDIGILRNGRPELEPEGAMIGGWRTRTKAVDIMTSGIGGDSRIIVFAGKIQLAPQRVIPLCIAASQNLVIRDKLQAVADGSRYLRTRLVIVENIPQFTEFFTFCRNIPGLELSKTERAFIDMVKEEPRSVFEVADLTGMDPYSFNPRFLEELGVISRIGLTPTDILHALGEYNAYDAVSSRLGVAVQAKAAGMDDRQFCTAVKKAVIDKISKELLLKMVFEDTGLLPDGQLSEAMIQKISADDQGRDYSMRVHLGKSIIGIGAPVGAYLPAVAERYATRLFLPEHAEVGNAIGAISGNVMETVEVTIRPKAGFSIYDDPPCFLFSRRERKSFPSLRGAKEYGMRYAKEEAASLAALSGSESAELYADVKDEYGALGSAENGVYLYSVINVTAIGKPKWSQPK